MKERGRLRTIVKKALQVKRLLLRTPFRTCNDCPSDFRHFHEVGVSRISSTIGAMRIVLTSPPVARALYAIRPPPVVQYSRWEDRPKFKDTPPRKSREPLDKRAISSKHPALNSGHGDQAGSLPGLICSLLLKALCLPVWKMSVFLHSSARARRLPQTCKYTQRKSMHD